ncbi:unnamed protein product [Pneumocystis jirovecii]|uniref:Uncharacterized protein n=2 Tax=Pneumocystis jirovecii TaxID=42068 RepID=L0PET1_PNEJI|nr:uncharacterized protein T551_00171 [Pneumocystis jirovecii RU7]KTW32686.1 hypothetical protein T551_00171 [Pneumocystis jirovecii RU7]CCJ30747.1 unnamed protein product [Pneumocystis jirovecii]
MVDCELKCSSRGLGWLRRIFRRIEDRRLERKFQAGMRYSEYAVHTSSGSVHVSDVLTYMPVIVSHRYGENNNAKKNVQKMETSESATALDTNHTQRVKDAHIFIDKVSADPLSSLSNAIVGSETHSISTGSPIVSLSAASTPARMSNNKCFRDLYRASIDTNASMRALAPSSRQSSRSSFSSAWTASKLGVLFLPEPTVAY